MAISTATSQQTVNSTTSTVTRPGTPAAGDMLLAFVAQDSGAVSNTWATATELLDATGPPTGIVATAAYRIVVGGDGNPVATHTTERSNHIAVLIPAAEWANDGTAPVMSTLATGSSTTPDATGVTFGWSATHETIFVVACFVDDVSGGFPITVWPTGYTANQVSNVTATSAGQVASAVKPSSAASSPEDPSAFTLTATETWAAIVIAVKGLALAGGVTVTPGIGTMTLTGFAPSVVVNNIVTPGIGTLTLTGFAPTVLTPRLVTPGIGTMTLTGFAPTVLTPRLVTPGIGTMTLTAFAPSVTVGVNVVPGVGTLTLTGFAPTVLTPRLVTPGIGTLTLTGFAPTVLTPRLVVPGIGTLTLTGFAPTVLTPSLVVPGIGTLTLTPFAPTVTVTAVGGVVAIPGVGVLTLTGYPPSVKVLVRVLDPFGSYPKGSPRYPWYRRGGLGWGGLGRRR